MPEKVTRKNLGAWVLKCNPKVWDLALFLEVGGEVITDWSVAENYRAGLMRKGDPAVFWVSGARTGEVTYRGLWGVGRLTGEPMWNPAGVPDPQDSLWLDSDMEDQHDYGVLTDIPLLHDPIPADVIASDPVLRACEIFRAQQMANPSFLTKEEYRVLKQIIKTEKPSKKEETVSIGEHGAGFGDSEKNKKVEDAAIKAVTRLFEKAGYEVADVSSKKLGWDLTVYRLDNPEKQRRVEVKGVSSGTPKVLLTANEVKTAESDKAWELAVVTSALSKPKVTLYSRAEVDRRARPFVFQADMSKAKPSRKGLGKR